VPVGLFAQGMRKEHDSLGAIDVPADHYWGAQTQRSLEHFNLGNDPMPMEVNHAYGSLKKAAAIVNGRAGRLPAWKAQLIARVCDEVIEGRLDAEFPLFVWQTGSGTHTNMNVNEVIANRAIQLAGGALGSQKPVHPNDDVNMAQSSNDTFPTAMHLAAYGFSVQTTLPALRRLADTFEMKAQGWRDVVKIGRTHLQDATPLTVGQEWSAFAAALEDATGAYEASLDGLLDLAMGGTAVGTGLNAWPGFAEQAAAVMAELTGFPLRSAPNKFVALATLDRLVRAHAALKGVAVTLFKIADDFRWLGSGPRTGLRELNLPVNEPGSSIMPGKGNPSQAEAMLMVCIDVMASDVAVQMAGAEGNFQLNVFRPIVIDKMLRSLRLLAGICENFRRYLVEGTELNHATIDANVAHSVMMVTALSPFIGYDAAAKISHDATAQDIPLRQAALAAGVDEALYDRVVQPLKLTHL
jgi:fumarate hydratase class II